MTDKELNKNKKKPTLTIMLSIILKIQNYQESELDLKPIPKNPENKEKKEHPLKEKKKKKQLKKTKKVKKKK